MEKMIPIDFDKSHVITLGKKMYSNSIDLLRELVNNSYDADATEAHISLKKNMIIVEDNGSGMDLEGLKQYFIIGSKEKQFNSFSPKYNRIRIGELGIGKFSSLGASSKFEVITRKGIFSASVTFDQEMWNKNEEDWNVPCIIHDNPILENDGTKVVLYNVKQDFSPQEVANRLRTSVPINNPNFTVYINGVELQPMFHEGRRFPVDIDTKYGKIIGQLILKDKGVSHRDEGIDCCVKGVMIKKSLFGFEGYKKGENRIVGKINADFLPFTASRDDFIKDSDEYLLFSDLMRKKVSFVFNLIQDAHRDKEMDQSGEALIKAAKMFNNAFKNAPHLFPKTYSHVTDSHTNSEDLDEISSSSIITNKSSRKRLIRKKPIIQRGEYKKVHINPLFEHKVIKRLKTDFGFTFAFTEEGSEGLPSYYVNDTIYVNREHRLYKYYNNDIESEVAHLVRILTAEAILLLDPLDMRQSYEKQIELLSAIYVKAKQYLNQ